MTQKNKKVIIKMADKTIGRKIVYYTESNEIEIMTDTKYEMLFKNLNEFVDMIKTSPRLVAVLKEKLEVI